ncbi:TPA: hypothetical protein HA242_01485 [Candidatus Woesearchaeota archaeon]|nr:hypothetical protein [Candidatus Woesearchaeota archaeon]HIG92684.1 hypothetical protein [Candidatus Woesearchaeota archaeon]HIH12371.1 hypothetical protein [Candidatus Woesearchaeota archaeon]
MSELFEWLVQYHLDTNLSPVLPHIKHGRAYSAQGEPAIEGEENDWAKGCLIIANGQTLAQRLREDKIILDHVAPRFSPAPSYGQFSDYLAGSAKKDGAFVYDGSHRSIARVARFTNASDSLDLARQLQLYLLPANFVFEKNETPLTGADIDEHIGTKTDLAICAPIAYTIPGSDVHAYQVKRTGYGDLGLGKVTHFAKQGLVEELFFRYAPDSDGPFIDEEHAIVGVHRKYEKLDGRVQLKSEQLWNTGYREELREVV